MKKILLFVVVAALVLSLGAISVFEASDLNNNGFTDADNDGVCDNRTDGGTCPQNGTGKRAEYGNAGNGSGYVDADNDGVCDNRTDGGTCPQDGTGAHNSRRGGSNK